ncbi:MAG: sigma 54-interacting transcriptional regulator [Myxococcaceae bacterium]|nr:sigma 54-interacting transcriptional regulator [Myxococcaceae bacterium]
MSTDKADGTLSLVERSRPKDAHVEHLFVVMSGDRPLEPAARHRLEGIEEVVIGRARERKVSREGKQLSLVFPDRWMSSLHGRLLKKDGAWWLEDGGSKNGVFRLGVQVGSATLNDGDVFELGQTFFCFRSAVLAEKNSPKDVSADQIAGSAAQLTTLWPPLQRTFGLLNEISRSNLPVLVRGETGTGKEGVARAIHALSGRKGAFTAVNCGALPATLLESELFGFKKGAFSGATEDRPGLVRSADDGTLFLDEIGELPAAAQTALLRVLQEREVMPVGSAKAVPVDVRVVGATHKDLEGAVARNEFRADLLARLRGFTAGLPALRERREDLGLLVQALLRRNSPDVCESVSFTPAAVRTLFNARWPENVRELERRLAAAALLAKDRAIEVTDLFAESLVASAAAAGSAPVARSTPTAQQLEAALREEQGNVVHAAQRLGTHARQVYRWVEKYGLSLETFRNT